MFPLAIACGNTFILKPSERVAMTANFMVNLLKEINLPNGVVNLVHGAKPTVDSICQHPDIKSINFVGGNAAGEYIWENGTKNGKRVLTNLGAKNHAVIMPDADKEDTINALVSAAMGSSGQRCMALTTAVFVGDV
jgi:malonate-semialdehyde dehydrogenase (acetylating)/methylmalonate-semialdehyde dehydrogenase